MFITTIEDHVYYFDSIPCSLHRYNIMFITSICE